MPTTAQRRAALRKKEKWAEATAFPRIARAINRLYRDPDKFVSRRDIARLLLRDADSRTLIATAYKTVDHKRFNTIDKYAGNMIDWFSKSWTEGDPKWLWLFNKFERSEDKIDDCWAYKPLAASAVNVFPDEVDKEEVEGLPEGAVFKRLVNAYERNPLNRQECIKKYGTNCYVCGFSFGATYGSGMDGFIHVHHLRQLSEVGAGYIVDPIADLRPVCPNCHGVIHHRPKQPYTIEEVQAFLRK